MAGCSWQAERPGRYSFGERRLLVDTAELPEMDGAAAGLPGSLGLGLGPDLGREPGRREVCSSETAAAVAAQTEGLRAEGCILLKEGGRVSLIHPREKSTTLQHNTTAFLVKC